MNEEQEQQNEDTKMNDITKTSLEVFPNKVPSLGGFAKSTSD